MGLMDAFGAECRVEITVRELIATLDEKAKAEAGFNVAMDMLREGVAPETVRAVFGFKPKEKEPTPAEAETSSKGNYTNNNTTKSAESQALESAKAKMMLDLGETQDSISEKTGFSKTTVRHRLKLLELDPEEFRKAEERQPKLTDYIELEKITDPDLKSKALAAIGTANFDWVVKNAVETEQKRRYEAEWREYVKDLGTEVKYEDKNSYTEQGFFYTRNELTDKGREEIAAFEKPLYYCFDSYGYVYMLNERSQSEEPKHETEPEWKIEAREREAKKARIIETENMAQALRLGFVKGYSRRNGMTALLIELIWEEMELDTVDWAYVAELCGVKLECEEDEDISAEDFAQNSDIVYMLVNSPAKVLLAIIAAYLEKSIYNHVSLHNYNGDYEKNAILEHWYATLQKLGYNISDDEKAMLDGTHECFGNNKED